MRSKRGNTHILVISDAFTKFVVEKSTKTTLVLSVLNELTSYFALPKRIITDRGTAFTIKLFKEYCDRKNTAYIKTAERTQRVNGQVERANQIVLSHLRTTTKDTKD